MNTYKRQSTEKSLLILVLIIFAMIAGLYSIMVPPFEMSDELWHYPMVKTLADGNGLPIQDPDNPGPWKQEGSQPPLYYYIGAATTFWIDTSDVNEILRPNPHVDNGIITPDGNINLIVHNYRKESWPWQGTTLAVHIVRFLSVLMSTAAVYFTYRISLTIFPRRNWLAISGAAAMAFTPMFAFISGAVNNDSLATLLAAVGLCLMLQIIRKAEEDRRSMGGTIGLGIILGLAALTKTSTLGLFGLAGLTMAYAAWRQKRWQTFFVEGPLIIILAAAIAGWWYYRNWQLYGDPLGLNAFIEILGKRDHPASLLQLWGERHGFMQSYWGLFGGVNVPMPGWIYTTLNTLAVLGVIGALITLCLKVRQEGLQTPKWMPTLLSLGWIALVAIPLALSWARITWSSQGRLVFSAISTISIWFIAGLSAWLPERLGKITAGTVVVFMAGVTLIAPFAWIAPKYQLPEQESLASGERVYDFTAPGTLAPAMRLINYELGTHEIQPGGVVKLTLYWESLAPMDRDWSAFIHLVDSVGVLAGQRDTYPGLGLIATHDLETNHQWVDTYVVPIKESAYAPEQLTVQVGLYDYTTFERMLLPDGSNTMTLGKVKLIPREGNRDIPNPVSFNFGKELELIGYQLDVREARPGDTIALTLYWHGLRQMGKNYTISAQILGPETRIYGQRDSWPHSGDFPTTAWTPGKIVEDTYPLMVSTETPPGIYDIQIVVYWLDETGEINRVQRITDDGRLVDAFILLTRIRVTE